VPDLAPLLPPLLATVLDGLVALRLLEHRDPAVLADRTAAVAPHLADQIAGYGDRITALGNFLDPEDRRDRSRVLAAMATCLAVGAAQPGGITWAGRHWCTADHLDCDRKAH
jgi:hypothetical protein